MSLRDLRMSSLLLFVLGVALAGCTTVVDPSHDFSAAQSLIHDTTGMTAAFDPEASVLSAVAIEQVLAEGLTLDETLSLALANNRRLHAGFFELGVGHADFVQAGLLKNPSLSLAFLLPSGGGRSRVGADLIESVAEVWQLRERKEVARLSQDQRILDLSRFAGELIGSTKAAYFEAVAARETHAVTEQNTTLARMLLAKIQRQVELGVATKTDADLARATLLSAELNDQRQSQAEGIAKQRLASLLSLDMDMRKVGLTDALPGVDAMDGLDAELVARCQQTRLDVRAATLALKSMDATVRLERSRTVPSAAIGITAERPESGSATSFLGGITGTIELPIFDQNHAQVRRAEYRRNALAKELEALSAEVAAQVRAALDRANAAKSVLLFVERDVLPQALVSATHAQRAYELGETTLLSLLGARQRVLLVEQEFLDAQLELARAQLELERSAGTPLSVLRRTAQR
ncbi:MAG: TolC family protein [Planctomycetes bacterium]|nr:TolC family protein [Planctomycetota bacterium]